MSKYKAVLFDLDGTLLDTTEGVVAAVRKTIMEHHLPMPDDIALKAFVGPPMQESMRNKFGMDEEMALLVANDFRKNYRSTLFQAKLYDGVPVLLEQLHDSGIKTAVATNKSHQNAMEILERFGINELCDFARGSDLEGRLNKKDIIDICIEVLNCKKNETVLVGDSIYDLQGADEANIDFIGVTYGFGFSRTTTAHKSRQYVMVDDLQQLTEYLLN